jgi:short-subunit dehydrogenase
MPKTKPGLPPRSTPLKPRPRALIIGASSGIGAALARRLAKEGYTLAVLARRSALLKVLCDEINHEAGEVRALAYTHNVTDFESVPALLQQILKDLGGLDLVIYNAGITIPGGMKHYEFDKDKLVTETNYLGAVAWLDPIATFFHNLGTGHIVGISSVAGDRGRVGNPAYNASKAALTCYLEALRNRLTRRGVHVLTIKPGYVLTDMASRVKNPMFAISPDKAAAAISKAIRKRKQVVYIAPIWALIMLVVRNIPSFLFRRMSF